MSKDVGSDKKPGGQSNEAWANRASRAVDKAERRSTRRIPKHTMNAWIAAELRNMNLAEAREAKEAREMNLIEARIAARRAAARARADRNAAASDPAMYEAIHRGFMNGAAAAAAPASPAPRRTIASRLRGVKNWFTRQIRRQPAPRPATNQRRRKTRRN